MCRKTLFVDDDFMIVETLERKFDLLAPDADFFYTSDPFEALEIIEEEKPEMVVSDVQMPECNGVELFEKVSQQ